MSTSESPDRTTTRKFTKARAILAGGLVLGVGAAVTLAAWNDSEFATGTFAAGEFGIEGATTGEPFAEHDTEETAEVLEFEVDADTLTPGDAVYAGYGVQLTADSNYAADVVVGSEITGDNAANLTAAFVYTTDATCDAAAFAAGTDENVATFTLDATQTPTYVCIEVTAGPDLAQGAAAGIMFEFAATSTDELAA